MRDSFGRVVRVGVAVIDAVFQHQSAADSRLLVCLAIMPLIVTRYCSMICMSSVTLMHPAKAVGLNEMPFYRDTRVVASNVVLDLGPDPLGRVIWGQYPQFAIMPLIA